MFRQALRRLHFVMTVLSQSDCLVDGSLHSLEYEVWLLVYTHRCRLAAYALKLEDVREKKLSAALFKLHSCPTRLFFCRKVVPPEAELEHVFPPDRNLQGATN